MITKIRTGHRMQGLLAYLVDTRSEHTFEVHERPTLVAASDPSMMDTFGGRELSQKDGQRIAYQLDEPRKIHGVSRDQVNVVHVILSIDADEGELSYDQWAQIAEEHVRTMRWEGASGDPEQVSWAAIHHGKSANGNDHIQIAISTVKEDGRKIDRHNDYSRGRKASRHVEHRFGLRKFRPTPGQSDRTEPAWDRQRAARRMRRAAAQGTGASAQARGDHQSDTQWLAERLRAAVAASTSEAEFVRRLRQANITVIPRFAAGGTSQVTGYSVKRPGSEYQRAGSKLGKDLSLPAVRHQLAAHSDAEALAEWRAAHAGLPPVHTSGRESKDVPHDMYLAKAARTLAHEAGQLRRIDPADHDLWRQRAREVAGLCAALANTCDGEDAEAFRAAAWQLGRRSSGRVTRPASPVTGCRNAAAVALRMAAAGKSAPIGHATLVREVVRLVQLLGQAREQAGYAQHARQLAAAAAGPLQQVYQRWEQAAPAVPPPPAADIDPQRAPHADTPTPARRPQHRGPQRGRRRGRGGMER